LLIVQLIDKRVKRPGVSPARDTAPLTPDRSRF
jgi:hypothetical protein